MVASDGQSDRENLLMKSCAKCKESKPVTSFGKQKGKPDGRMRACKLCKKAYERWHRVRYGDRLRATNKRWREANRVLIREYEEKHASANSEKRAAKMAVMIAKRSGSLPAGPCEECGTTDMVDAHHDSYAASKRLDVRWLCRAHHKEWHRTREYAGPGYRMKK